MENSNRSERILLGTALFMGALLIGYNAFFVPGTESSAIVETMSRAEENAPDSSGSEDDNKTENESEEESNQDETDNSEESENNESDFVNINTASAKEIADKLERIDSVIADRIVDYRQKNGGFSDISEIKNIKGIGEKTFERIKGKLTVK